MMVAIVPRMAALSGVRRIGWKRMQTHFSPTRLCWRLLGLQRIAPEDDAIVILRRRPRPVALAEIPGDLGQVAVEWRTKPAAAAGLFDIGVAGFQDGVQRHA